MRIRARYGAERAGVAPRVRENPAPNSVSSFPVEGAADGIRHGRNSMQVEFGTGGNYRKGNWPNVPNWQSGPLFSWFIRTIGRGPSTGSRARSGEPTRGGVVTPAALRLLARHRADRRPAGRPRAPGRPHGSRRRSRRGGDGSSNARLPAHSPAGRGHGPGIRCPAGAKGGPRGYVAPARSVRGMPARTSAVRPVGETRRWGARALVRGGPGPYPWAAPSWARAYRLTPSFVRA